MGFKRYNNQKPLPLPLINVLLDQLSGASIFSKIDLTAGYNQVRVANNDIPKTAFRTKYGAYKSVVIYFGMNNAPSTFVTLMNSVFRPHIRKSVVIYLDNIIVFSKSKAQQNWTSEMFSTFYVIISYTLSRPSASFMKRA